MSKPSYALRVLHILRTPVGGLFRHVCDLAEEQASRGCHVGIICDSQTGGVSADERLAALERYLALGLHRVAIPRMPGPLDLAAHRRISSIVEASRPDILHGHGAKGGAFARLAKANGGASARPCGAFYTPHGGTLHYEPASLQGRIFFGFERWAMKYTAAIVFESHYGLSAFSKKIGQPSCPTEIVHNGLRSAEFEPVKPVPDPYDVLFIGEMRKLKGVDTLLQALAQLKGEGREKRALLVGAGPDEDAFRARATQLGLSGSVSFSEPMTARDAFALASCVAVPSRKESLPYIVLEACAAGLPVIATNVGGIGEIFGDQRHRLIPPDDPALLARTLDDMLDGLPAARERAEVLKSHLKARFSVERMTEDILAAYERHADLAPEVSEFFASQVRR